VAATNERCRHGDNGERVGRKESQNTADHHASFNVGTRAIAAEMQSQVAAPFSRYLRPPDACPLSEPSLRFGMRFAHSER
jgi:hypothetical protein